MSDIIRLDSICKSYGDKCVLNNISFSIKENEILGLIGLNGIGKTTLIKTILDFLKPNSGKIYTNNKLSESVDKKIISYLPEKFQPPRYLKGIEFLKLFSENFEIDRLKKLCDMMDFKFDDLNNKISNYSKGMTQKIGLISSVLDEKKLLILDEPMSGLDPKARICLKDIILNYKNNGKSVFFSSHILYDIDEICDRIAVINDTKLVFLGNPKELRERYDNISLEKAFLRLINN